MLLIKCTVHRPDMAVLASFRCSAIVSRPLYREPPRYGYSDLRRGLFIGLGKPPRLVSPLGVQLAMLPETLRVTNAGPHRLSPDVILRSVSPALSRCMNSPASSGVIPGGTFIHFRLAALRSSCER